MSDGPFAIGFVLCMVAGFLNGSWQLPMKERCPPLLRVIQSSSIGWQWENLWLMYNISAIVLEVIIVYSVLDASILNTVYRSAKPGVLGIVCVFCILWGLGSYGFGLAVKLLGMAFGTGICMGIVLVLGTLLPLFVNNLDRANTSAFGLTIFGAALGTLGFSLSAVAGSNSTNNRKNEMTEIVSNNDGVGIDASDSADEAGNYSADCHRNEKVQTSRVDPADPISTGVQHGPNDRPGQYHSLFGVMVAVIGGTLASLLQFAFVFGQPLIRAAEDSGAASAFSTQAVWLLAFTLSCSVNVLYSCVLLTQNGTWPNFYTFHVCSDGDSGSREGSSDNDGNTNIEDGARSGSTTHGEASDEAGLEEGKVVQAPESLFSEYQHSPESNHIELRHSYTHEPPDDGKTLSSLAIDCSLVETCDVPPVAIEKEIVGIRTNCASSPISPPLLMSCRSSVPLIAPVPTRTREVCWALRNMFLGACIAAVWLSHITLYGYAQSLMGELGAGKLSCYRRHR